MKKTLTIGLVILIMIALPSMVFASSPWVGQSPYGKTAIDKLSFGLKNTTGGWTELLRRPFDKGFDGKGMLLGLGQGIYNTVTYTVGGAMHLGTFPITSLDIPIPDNGVSF